MDVHPMSTAVLMMCDNRRQYTAESLASLAANLPPDMKLFIHDDSMDRSFNSWLLELTEQLWHGDFEVIQPLTHKRGFGGAIQYAWQHIYDLGEFEYILHTENDFTFNEPINLVAMRRILDSDSTIAQVALLRQSWSKREKMAGGVIPSYPAGAFRQHRNTEHSEFWTTNTSLLPMWVAGLGWPDGDESEGMFTAKLRKLGLHFAYYGGVEDPPRITHIGYDRVSEKAGY
jgi:hypothetical protein